MKNYLLNFASANATLVTGLSPTMVLFANMNTGATIAPPSITEAVTGWGLYTFQWGTTTPIVFMCDGATSGLGSFRYIKGSLDPADRADEYGTSLVALGTSNIALGTTNMALGTSNIAIGTTNIAFGTSNFALGTSNIALGMTSVAIGTSIYALEQTLGSTLVAIGNTSIALGITNVAISTSLSATSVTITVAVAGVGAISSTFGGSGSDPIDLFGYMKRIQENLEGNETFTKTTGALQIYSRGSSALLITKTITNGTSTVTKV